MFGSEHVKIHNENSLYIDLDIFKFVIIFCLYFFNEILKPLTIFSETRGGCARSVAVHNFYCITVALRWRMDFPSLYETRTYDPCGLHLLIVLIRIYNTNFKFIVRQTAVCHELDFIQNFNIVVSILDWMLSICPLVKYCSSPSI